MSVANVNIEKFGDFTQILNKDYRILYFKTNIPHPSPLQWTFFVNELTDNLNVLKKVNGKFAFILDLNLIGLLSTNYILEFVNILKAESILSFVCLQLSVTVSVKESPLLTFE